MENSLLLLLLLLPPPSSSYDFSFSTMVLRSSIFEEANPDQDFNMNVWRGRILDRVTADVLGNEFGGETFFAVYSRPRPPSIPSPIPAKLGNGRGGRILPETFLHSSRIVRLRAANCIGARSPSNRDVSCLSVYYYTPKNLLTNLHTVKDWKVARIKRNLIIEGGERKSSDRFSLSYPFQQRIYI